MNILSRLLKPRPLLAEGSRWTPMPHDEIYERLRSGQRFEAHELDFVVAIAERTRVFWDVGANFGLFSVTAAKRLSVGGRVLSVEPEPRNAARLRENMRLNELTNVEVVEVAIGPNTGTVEFTSCEQGAYSGLRPTDSPGTSRLIQVKQTTLDQLAADQGWPEVDLLKMDVEGAELLALQGGEQFFQRSHRPIVLAEFSDRRSVAYGYRCNEVYRWLEARGYRWYAFSDRGQLRPEECRDTYDYSNLVGCPVDKLGWLAPHVATTGPSY